MILLLVALIIPLRAASALPDWEREAQHLIGGGDHQTARATKALLSRPTLDEELRAALKGPERFLAMDLIAALKRRALLGDLIEFSEKDETGFSYLAILAFVTTKKMPEFSALFQARLEKAKTAPGARVILLDALSRMGVRLGGDVKERLLLREDSPEVRGAALSYLRRTLRADPNGEDLKLLKRFVTGPPPSRQLRTQAMFLIAELPPAARSQIGPAPWDCPANTPPALRSHCITREAPP